MRARIRVPLLAVLVLALACATTGPIVSPNPTAEQQMALRVAAARVVDGLNTGLEITRAAGRFIDTLPLSVAEKNIIDRAIVAVTGTTNSPGPLVAALDALRTVTSEASLKASVNSVLTVLDPLIVKLETHANLGVAGFGVSLRAATSFARALVNQGGGL